MTSRFTNGMIKNQLEFNCDHFFRSYKSMVMVFSPTQSIGAINVKIEIFVDNSTPDAIWYFSKSLHELSPHTLHLSSCFLHSVRSSDSSLKQPRCTLLSVGGKILKKLYWQLKKRKKVPKKLNYRGQWKQSTSPRLKKFDMVSM